MICKFLSREKVRRAERRAARPSAARDWTPRWLLHLPVSVLNTSQQWNRPSSDPACRRAALPHALHGYPGLSGATLAAPASANGLSVVENSGSFLLFLCPGEGHCPIRFPPILNLLLGPCIVLAPLTSAS